MKRLGVLICITGLSAISVLAGAPDKLPQKPEEPKEQPRLSCPEAGAVYRSTYLPELNLGRFDRTAPAIFEKAISSKRIPGGTLVTGGATGAAIMIARGTLSLDDPRLVTSETLYDLASMTKVIATATSIMILRERGLVSLKAPLQEYLPEFTAVEFGKVPLERFLRHRAGIRDVEIPKKHWWRNSKKSYFSTLIKKGLVPDPSQREQFRYTDAAYVLLGEVVERVSGLPLNVFARKEIFEPLGMKHTGYLPPAGSICARALRVCQVHDPLAFAFGGVSGNAGLFSTAEDVALFARMILNQGGWPGARSGGRLLSPESIELMTTDPIHSENRRGMGFDLDTDYSCAPRGGFSKDSFGHTGYTGTSLWIDRSAERFLVLLTNEVDIAKGSINAIRWCLAKSAADDGRF